MNIKDPKLISSIFKALGDEKSLKILSLLSVRSLSVTDIIRDTNIPSSSTYRKISELEKDGLIGIERTVITDDGKSFNIYKSTFVEINIKFRMGEYFIFAIPNRDIMEKAFGLFHSSRRDN